MREFILVEDRYILAAKGLSLEELALVEPFAIAAHGLRRGQIQAGDQVLVMGAGPIGLFTILIAKLKGAKVEVSELNADRLQFCAEQLGIPASTQTSYAKVIDATGNLAAIESGFARLAHGGQYILIGLQKQAIHFSHPEFHKREAMLMSSRNATIEDFEYVMDLFRQGKIRSEWFISHRFDWSAVGSEFPSIHDPARKIVKALITLKK
jgi:2-desacetyl-2-hydroxyethyl bacteriochlorophyllide A dehydrogenase